MLEVMIADIYWDNEYWCIKKVDSIKDLKRVLKYADGSVKNIIVDLKDCDDIKDTVETLFREFIWIDKVLIKEQKNLIGIYERNALL